MIYWWDMFWNSSLGSKTDYLDALANAKNNDSFKLTLA